MLDLSLLVPGLRLLWPGWLVVLALLPAWLLWLRGRRAGRGGLTLPVVAVLGGLPRSRRQRLLWLPDVLRAGVLALLALALSRPQLGRESETIKQKGVDIILALDVSGSMRARDVKPDRLTAAKETLVRFLGKVHSDRVGLVVFSGRSFTFCPLTVDYEVVATCVKRCVVGTVNESGTAIGDAIGSCVNRLLSPDERAAMMAGRTEYKPRSRVVVLLTDGENNTGELDPTEAATVAQQWGIRIHCVGLGSLAGAPVPLPGGGAGAGFERDPQQNLIVSRLAETELLEIARITGGEYHRATDAESLDRIYQRIAQMEKHDIQVTRVMRHEDRFPQVLLLAVGLLLLELVLRATWLRVES